MFRKVCAAAGLLLGLSGLALADTPIGPGATGAGGTGANPADAKARQDKGGPATQVREDGMPVDRADGNVRSDTPKKAGSGDARGTASGGAATGAVGSGETPRANPNPAKP